MEDITTPNINLLDGDTDGDTPGDTDGDTPGAIDGDTE